LSPAAAEIMRRKIPKSRSESLAQKKRAATAPVGKHKVFLSQVQPVGHAALRSSSSAPSLNARKLRSFDHKLARDFDEIWDERTAGWTYPRDAVLTFDREGAPSHAALLENFKKEHYTAQIERGEELGCKSPGGMESDDGLLEPTDTLDPEAFMSEVAATDQRIEAVLRGIRFENLAGNESAERENAEREEARRRKEEALRRARKKMQEARDPKRKIAYRLQNKRAFEMDTLDKCGIPTQMVDVQGIRGREKVELVDVRQLQTRCLFLGEGASVRTMLETLDHRERQSRLTRSGNASLSLPSLTGSSSFDFSNSLSHSGRLDDRIERAAMNREARNADSLVQKLYNVRGNLPYSLPFTWELSDRADETDEKRLVMKSNVQNPVAEKHRGYEIARTLATKFSAKGTTSKSVPSKTTSAVRRLSASVELMRLMGDIKGKGGKVQEATATTKKAKVAKIAVGNAEPAPLNEEALKRVRRRWAIFKSVAKWLIVHFLAERRRDAIVPVKLFLYQLGEWSRIRLSVVRMMRSVRTLQRACRAFLANKKKRCDALQREWMRVEDHHLSSYFRNYAQKIVAEQRMKAEKEGIPMSAEMVRKSKGKLKANSAEAKSKQAMLYQIQDALDDGNAMVDWRSYRIPVKERRQVISRYYMAQLRKHARMRSTFLEVVRTALQSERELISFLKALGAGDHQLGGFKEHIEETVMATSSSNPFWHFPEQTALQLIALSAQALAHVDPFQEHPANKDLPKTSPLQRSLRNRRTTVADAAVASLQFLDDNKGDAHFSLGRFAKGPDDGNKKDSPREESRKQQEQQRVDMEDLWRHFTPREVWREITEDQSASDPSASNAEAG